MMQDTAGSQTAKDNITGVIERGETRHRERHDNPSKKSIQVFFKLVCCQKNYDTSIDSNAENPTMLLCLKISALAVITLVG